MTAVRLSIKQEGVDNGVDEGQVDRIRSNRSDDLNDSILDELDGVTLELCAGVAIYEDIIIIRKVGYIGVINRIPAIRNFY